MHYPTDINLLFDALRKMITLIMRICEHAHITQWRQGKYHISKAKKFYRAAQRLKNAASKDAVKRAQREQLIIKAHAEYIALAQFYVDKVQQTLLAIESSDIITVFRIQQVEGYIQHAKRQIDQIRRRVIHGETIAHSEKVFSIFKPHTEWISKGKAGVPVCIVKDQFQFTLHHRVMAHEIYDQIAVPFIKEVRDRFPPLNECSFDKGFYSLPNQMELATLLEMVVLPREKQNRKAAQLTAFGRINSRTMRKNYKNSIFSVFYALNRQ